MNSVNEQVPSHSTSESPGYKKPLHALLAKKSYKIACLVVGIMMLAGSTLYVYTDSKIQKDEDTTNATKKTREDSYNSSQCKGLTYKHQNNFTISNPISVSSEEYSKIDRVFNVIDVVKEISEANGKRISYSYYPSLSPSGDMVAYIIPEGSLDEVETIYVYLYLFETKENRLVYQLDTKTFPDDLDYTQGIEDVGFSNDEQTLAITLSNGMYLYDIDTSELTEAFLFPGYKNEKGIDGIWSYGRPLFSNDDTKIVLSRGYYEGSDNILFDTVTKQIVELPYRGYVTGSSVVGWYKNNLIVEENHLNEEKQDEARLVLYPSLTESSIVKFNGSSDVPRYYLQESNLFVTKTYRIPSGQEVCDNKEKPYEVDSRMQTLSAINLDTKVERDIITVDSTNASGTKKGVTLFGEYVTPINGKNELIMYIDYYGKDKYFQIYPSAPNVLHEVVSK